MRLARARDKEYKVIRIFSRRRIVVVAFQPLQRGGKLSATQIYAAIMPSALESADRSPPPPPPPPAARPDKPGQTFELAQVVWLLSSSSHPLPPPPPLSPPLTRLRAYMLASSPPQTEPPPQPPAASINWTDYALHRRKYYRVSLDPAFVFLSSHPRLRYTLISFSLIARERPFYMLPLPPPVVRERARVRESADTRNSSSLSLSLSLSPVWEEESRVLNVRARATATPQQKGFRAHVFKSTLLSAPQSREKLSQVPRLDLLDLIYIQTYGRTAIRPRRRRRRRHLAQMSRDIPLHV